MRAGAFAVMSGLAASMTLAGAASAQTRTGHFAVRATVQKDCEITTTDLDFGTYNSTAASNGQTPLEVRCTPGTAASISFSGGLSGNPRDRTMRSGVNTLGYQLYRDPGRNDPIDTNGPAFELEEEDSTGEPVTFTTYGQIPSGQNAAAGTYIDIILVTIQF